MTTWPATLPQAQFLNTSEEDVDSVLRTQMDSGPPSRRNKFSGFMTTLRVPIIINGTQKQTFDTFYRTTLKNGALAFNWTDPTTDVATSYAFKSPPRWQLIRGGTAATRLWSTSLDLERQP